MLMHEKPCLIPILAVNFGTSSLYVGYCNCPVVFCHVFFFSFFFFMSFFLFRCLGKAVLCESDLSSVNSFMFCLYFT